MSEYESGEREPHFSEALRQEIIQYALQFGMPERLDDNEEATALEAYAYVLNLAVEELSVSPQGDETLRSGVVEFIDVLDEGAGQAADAPFVRIHLEAEVESLMHAERVEKLTTIFLFQNEVMVTEHYESDNRRLGADEYGLIDFTAEFHEPTVLDHVHLAEIISQLRSRYSHP